MLGREYILLVRPKSYEYDREDKRKRSGGNKQREMSKNKKNNKS
jgi:hypothetical protein